MIIGPPSRTSRQSQNRMAIDTLNNLDPLDAQNDQCRHSRVLGLAWLVT